MLNVVTTGDPPHHPADAPKSTTDASAVRHRSRFLASGADSQASQDAMRCTGMQRRRPRVWYLVFPLTLLLAGSFPLAEVLDIAETSPEDFCADQPVAEGAEEPIPATQDALSRCEAELYAVLKAHRRRDPRSTDRVATHTTSERPCWVGN